MEIKVHSYSIARVAKFTKRSDQTIRRLIKAGHLKAERINGELKIQHEGGVSGIQVVVAQHVKRTYIKSRRRKTPISEGLGILIKLASIDKNKLDLLLKIAEKYSVSDLEVILTLG